VLKTSLLQRASEEISNLEFLENYVSAKDSYKAKKAQDSLFF